MEPFTFFLLPVGVLVWKSTQKYRNEHKAKQPQIEAAKITNSIHENAMACRQTEYEIYGEYKTECDCDDCADAREERERNKQRALEVQIEREARLKREKEIEKRDRERNMREAQARADRERKEHERIVAQKAKEAERYRQAKLQYYQYHNGDDGPEVVASNGKRFRVIEGGK